MLSFLGHQVQLGCIGQTTTDIMDAAALICLFVVSKYKKLKNRWHVIDSDCYL